MKHLSHNKIQKTIKFEFIIDNIQTNLIAFYHLEKNVYAKISGLGFCDVTWFSELCINFQNLMSKLKNETFIAQ